MKPRRILAIIAGSASLLVLCVCSACLWVAFVETEKPEFKASQTARYGATNLAIANATQAALPTHTPLPSSTATKRPTATRTQVPPTATNTATATIDPLFTPPTSTPSETPTQTDTPTQTSTSTATATITLTPSKTATRRPTATPAPSYVSLLGRVMAGVKVYYGLGSNKAYGFEILGGSDDCVIMPSGKGLYVRYEDGTEEWKDRDAIVQSGLYFVLEDDPALKKLEWYIYFGCP